MDLSLHSQTEIRGDVLLSVCLEVMRHIHSGELGDRLPEMVGLLRELADKETALEYLEVTGDGGRLAKIEKTAIEAGDTFLLLRIEKIRGAGIPEGTWREVGERAFRLEKFYDAARAFERAGDGERVERIRADQMPGYEPWKPEGK